MNKVKFVTVPLSVLFMSLTAHSQDLDQKKSLEIKPSILEGKDKGGSTLGLEYQFSKNLLRYDVAPANPLQPDSFKSVTFDVAGTGTVALNSERNPKNFLDFVGSIESLYWSRNLGTFIGSLNGKFETDQSFKNKQGVFSINATFAKRNIFVKNGFFSVDVGYGRVDPRNDEARAAALQSQKLSTFNRWEAEVLYLHRTQNPTFDTIELNYRYFSERNAPLEIRQAGIAAHKLATIRLGIKKDFFVAYSRGSLPFNRKSDQIVQAGWSYKIQP